MQLIGDEVKLKSNTKKSLYGLKTKLYYFLLGI